MRGKGLSLPDYRPERVFIPAAALFERISFSGSAGEIRFLSQS